MSESLQICFSDIRAITRLLSECRELGEDSLAWRVHFYTMLGNLVGADLVSGGQLSDCMNVAAQVSHGDAVAGQSVAENMLPAEAGRAQLESCCVSDEQSIALTRESGPREHQWIRSPEPQLVARAIESGDCLHSLQPTSAAGHFDRLSLGRAPGKPRFSQREAVLAALLHGEVASLIGGPLAETREPTAAQLSQRLRQVLNCVLQGDSDKEIATRLNLSPHTVNQHTKRIFLHFKVNSRTELLARWIRRTWSLQAIEQAAAEAPNLE